MERFMDFQFVAAQQLTGVGDDHPAAVLHGHTFHLRVTVAADLDQDKGWVIDPGDMQTNVKTILESVDHRYLNEVAGLENPSTEAVCRFLQSRIAERLPGRVGVEIRENRDVGCSLAPVGATP